MTRRLIALFATDILAVSESTMLDAWGPSYQTDKRCRVLYNGFDLERFRTGSDAREAVRQGIGVGSDDLLLIHVGNQVAAKNHDKLIRVFVELAQSDERWRLVLIGRSDPEIQERLDHLIGLKGLGDKVSFLGVRQDVPELLSAADVMVHPSIREGFPGAILEGVAAGLPVVASDIPQNREVVMLGAAVSAVSLSEPDSTWAHVTRQIALQPQSSFEDRARWFSSHGLTTEDAVRRLLDVWLAESG